MRGPADARLLSSIYRTLMSITGRRGFHTLSHLTTRLFPAGLRYQVKSGPKLFIPPDPHFLGYILGHDSHIATRLIEVVKPGDVCVDAGANIGYFSLLLAGLVGVHGCVYAFEPEPENYRVLQSNGEGANAALGKVVIPCPFALSSVDGELALQRGPFSTYHQVRPVADQDHSTDIIRCYTLDTAMRRFDEKRRLRVVKIDVEGHELEVLAGSTRLLESSRIQNIVTEYHPDLEADGIVNFIERTRCVAEAWIKNRWVPFSTDISQRTDLWLTLQAK